jgi:hypothetical protein
VRQEVNTSAGKSALWGRVSCALQAASRMQSLEDPEAPPQSLSYQEIINKVILTERIIMTYIMATTNYQIKDL